MNAQRDRAGGTGAAFSSFTGGDSDRRAAAISWRRAARASLAAAAIPGGPADPAGLFFVSPLLSADGGSYAYNFARSLSNLYLVDGLQ